MSPHDRDDPFANFYFGGFGNNYVDHRDEKRYREYYAFPGVELNEIGGRNFVKSHGRVEPAAAALPPRRHTRVSISRGCGPRCSRRRSSTDLDAAGARRTRHERGRAARLSLQLLSTLDMTLSVGGGRGVRAGHPARDARPWSR